jgi:hypothetical protein
VLRKRHRVEAAKDLTVTNPIQNITMKNKLIIGGLLALIAVGAALAADLKYTTLPQDTDSALVLANKKATETSSNLYANIVLAAPTTTVVKSGSGILVGVVCNTPASGAVATVYDNTAGSGTKIATILGTAQSSLKFDCRFATGLTVVTSTAAADWTFIYR